MKSFNAYGQSAESFGGNTPVWLGTVKPIPMGAVLEASFVKAGAIYRAGTPVEYNAADRTFKPLANAEASADNVSSSLLIRLFITALICS